MGYGGGLSASLGVVVEGTVGTEATVNAWYEFLDESLQQTPTYLDSAGLKAGQAYKRAARTQISKYDVSGDITLEHFDRGFSAATGRGMGFWWKHALGQNTVSVIGTGAAYKQIAIPAAKDGLSFTTQIGRPQASSPYTSNAFTYRGCKVQGWEFTCSDGELAKLKLTLDGWRENTATGLVSPTFSGTGYQAGIFSFADVGTGNFTLGGTATTSTGTASETSVAGGTAVTTVVKGITITGATPLASERYGFGSAGTKKEQIQNAIPTITGSLDAEFTNRTEIYDLFANNTTTALVLGFTHYINGVDAAGVTGGTGANPYLLSFIMPAVKFKTGQVKLSGADILGLTVGFEAYDDGANPPIQVKLVSQDQLI